MSALVCLRAAGLCLAAFLVSAKAAETISWRDVDSGRPFVLVRGLTADERGRVAIAPERFLRVRVVFEGEDAAGLPTLSGTFDLVEDGLRFRPDFPLAGGMKYEAVFVRDDDPLVARIEIPRPALRPEARVVAVYPSAPVVPENLLKFYLHFSHSMSRGDVYRHITLLDEDEKAVELPFLEIGEELWDPGQKRLTLLIDPGRIKRGVKPLEEIGPALEAGRRYTLRIDRHWRDARGVGMVSGHRHQFTVTTPDRSPPDPGRWHLRPPRVGTRQPLVLEFPGPLDQALASRVIWVEAPDGAVVEGEVVLRKHETHWSLQPDRDWVGGVHRLQVATVLEDLAGNSIGRPFEVDQFERVGDGIKELPFTRPFEPVR